MSHSGNIAQKKYFVDTASKMEYYVKHFINCKITHVIDWNVHSARCSTLDGQRPLQDRLAEHKYAIRVGNEDYPMARHYKSLHHGKALQVPTPCQPCIPTSYGY